MKYPSKSPSKSSFNNPLKSHVLNVILSVILNIIHVILNVIHVILNVILNIILNAEVNGTWLENMLVMVWIDYLSKKSLLVVSGEWVGGRPNLMLAQVQVFGPKSLDLLDLTWDLTWT